MNESIWEQLPDDFRDKVDQSNQASGLMSSLVKGCDPPAWIHTPSLDVKEAVHRMLTFMYGRPVTEETATRYLPILLSLFYPNQPRQADVLVAASIATLGAAVTDGLIVESTGPTWYEILREIECNASFLFQFAHHPRKFEEFVAACYRRDGWPEVILTPRSNDGGRDIIATKPGFASVRVLVQCKAYSPGNLVTHDDVRAMLGVLQTHPNSSKAIITTTSQFQTGVLKSGQFAQFIPHRLELQDGEGLIKWLLTLRPGAFGDLGGG